MSTTRRLRGVPYSLDQATDTYVAILRSLRYAEMVLCMPIDSLRLYVLFFGLISGWNKGHCGQSMSKRHKSSCQWTCSHNSSKTSSPGYLKSLSTVKNTVMWKPVTYLYSTSFVGHTVVFYYYIAVDFPHYSSFILFYFISILGRRWDEIATYGRALQVKTPPKWCCHPAGFNGWAVQTRVWVSVNCWKKFQRFQPTCFSRGQVKDHKDISTDKPVLGMHKSHRKGDGDHNDLLFEEA